MVVVLLLCFVITLVDLLLLLLLQLPVLCLPVICATITNSDTENDTLLTAIAVYSAFLNP